MEREDVFISERRTQTVINISLNDMGLIVTREKIKSELNQTLRHSKINTHSDVDTRDRHFMGTQEKKAMK